MLYMLLGPLYLYFPNTLRIFQCMLERTDAITKEIPEPITFVLAYHTVLQYFNFNLYDAHTQCCLVIKLYAATQPGLLAL